MPVLVVATLIAMMRGIGPISMAPTIIDGFLTGWTVLLVTLVA